MSRIFSDYIEKAKKILDDNWLGSSTKPAPSLYPHQWNWDSAFIAIGRSHYDTERAMQEIETLFKAQWSNGMIPQIVFNREALGHYFPEPDFWLTERSPHAPELYLTSGITMPPVHAIAAEKIYMNARKSRLVLSFLKRIYPKILRLHEYLYRERDPKNEGLVYIRHPWESGIDNSPTWDEPLKRITVDKTLLPPYERKDLKHGIDPKTRPSDDDYDRYVYLVDLFRKNEYDEARISTVCPFLIQDPLFNSILCRANESLIHLAELIGENPGTPKKWAEKTAGAIRDKLWNEEHDMFDAYDIVADKVIEADTSAGFLPLFAGAATREQAQKIYNRMNSRSFCALNQGNCFTIPNYDTQKEGFDRSNYWRGPVWININWMLAHGLRRYGYTLKADSLQKDLLQLPIRYGFHEYFDSFEGTGYGTDNFSWTAALFIDIAEEFYASQKKEGVWLVKRLKAEISSGAVLNDGKDMSNVPDENLSSELMKSIRKLRNMFYDTKHGRVDYHKLADSDAYRTYRLLTNGLQIFDPSRLLGHREKIAFWVNLYNTIVVDGIVKLGIQQSVKEVPGFFSSVKYDIGGYLFSPDDIEHGILRGNKRPWFHPFKQFGLRDKRREWAILPLDPRIHFALVCGSRSCPPIDYYDSKKIYDQLSDAAISFVNSSEVVVLPEDGKLMLSEIFRWYESDFGSKSGVIDFIFDYLAEEKARDFLRQKSRDLTFEYIYYDWNLNR
ncbi:MAG: DUF547 domain-containing protein [Candidatus Scalindua sp. AMX11]|nr:MAG: DUF547 domain-containing protein [Candidatus Scalindua sp.]NOG84926.1 DUF547 domain-containing protein [Planctomycetota bacterium]RZV84988.1 MAG: DUF547 domain-containing protein [Candidatus Scalindua sp. SCAELEC01]TDE63922.1 MAG: DUF547 domain-containing protein [Candidatus Scalindua sp. AMX11]GJQ60703.1 MAG: hypothetical protein SCALA701_35040 [Candidatus Scalindua sp.]